MLILHIFLPSVEYLVGLNTNGMRHDLIYTKHNVFFKFVIDR